jgi:hypothetical protein
VWLIFLNDFNFFLILILLILLLVFFILLLILFLILFYILFLILFYILFLILFYIHQIYFFITESIICIACILILLLFIIVTPVIVLPLGVLILLIRRPVLLRYDVDVIKEIEEVVIVAILQHLRVREPVLLEAELALQLVDFVFVLLDELLEFCELGFKCFWGGFRFLFRILFRFLLNWFSNLGRNRNLPLNLLLLEIPGVRQVHLLFLVSFLLSHFLSIEYAELLFRFGLNLFLLC